MYTFEGQAGEHFRTWESRTETILEIKDDFHVVMNDRTGDDKNEPINDDKLEIRKGWQI